LFAKAAGRAQNGKAGNKSQTRQHPANQVLNWVLKAARGDLSGYAPSEKMFCDETSSPYGRRGQTGMDIAQ